VDLSDFITVLKVLQPFVYGGLFLVALLELWRRPSPAHAWLVATFGVLALVVVAGQVLPEDSTHPAVLWAGKALIAALVLFPYFLYRFMTTFIRPTRWIWLTAKVLTAALSLGAFLLPRFPQSDEPRPAWLQVYVAVLLVQWVFLSGIVAVQLWRGGRGQPTVARRRMRTMSIGASGLALALLLGGGLSKGNVVDIVVQILVLAAAPLMLVGFAPPRTLRLLWCRREQAELKQASRSLMKATTSTEVAKTLLPHARMLVGAAGAILEDANGAVVASDGLGGDGAAPQGSSNGSVVTIPLRAGRLVVMTSPLTPFFGHEEVSELEGLAALADLALARNELLDNQRRLGAIVESSDDAIISESPDGTILSWNRGAEKIYGYNPEEAIGEQVAILDPPGPTDGIPETIRRTGGVEQYETRHRTKDGRTIDVSLTISPIRNANGTVVGASTIARDVTERINAEQERESAREEADRANRAKSEFLSRMSHELRTPLNAILGFTQLLQMDDLTAEQQEGTGEISKAGKHLLQLIDEVLDISRIEAGKLRLSLEPVDAIQTVEECISLLGPQAEQEGVTLSLGPHDPADRSAYVTADHQRLKQVMLNLISNGIKYNRQDGSVRVSIDRTERGRRIRIDVADTGRGIPAEQLEQLFAPFERLGAEGSSIDGTGLGLALSRPLVEAMGGVISVTSEPGVGSTFSVELAAADDAEELAEDDDPSLGDAEGLVDSTSARKVLHIEDNLSNLKLVERVIARRPGILLLSAMQGGMGVSLARDHQPDLILLDLDLPDVPGEEVLARLRSDPRTAAIPVVVVSANTTSGRRSRLISEGARAVIDKPISLEQLMQIVETYCPDGEAALATDEQGAVSSV
jgi:PAS domain S-box-containing protein